ncbi:helix-turn-helix domain-containing protein [Microbacterium sp. AZCO]|uniref:winged helix-turn-helix transcriptional regulator n=1 Tax=Microbacterium sp. AZCO TaxID=3142976 RepID=UPI0031F46C37
MEKSEPVCQIVRTLDVIGEKWALLIVRNALRGQTRFSEFRDGLGAPSDVLTDRLAKLVAHGILEKSTYREPGERARPEYRLTPRGEALRVVLAAMIQWGDEFNPAPQGRSAYLVDAKDDRRLRVAYLDDSGAEVDRGEVAIAPGPAATTTWVY